MGGEPAAICYAWSEGVGFILSLRGEVSGGSCRELLGFLMARRSS